jgi:hypothetical protein
MASPRPGRRVGRHPGLQRGLDLGEPLMRAQASKSARPPRCALRHERLGTARRAHAAAHGLELAVFEHLDLLSTACSRPRQ